RRRRGPDGGGGKRGLGRRVMMARDRFVGDDRSPGARTQRGNLFAQQGQLTASDDDIVAALAERDVDDDQIAGAQRRSHDRRSPSAGGAGIAQERRICPASALTISSTIFSGSPSRDLTGESAQAIAGPRSPLALRR